MKPQRGSFAVGVKLLSGKSFSVTVQSNDTVAALKQRIFEREGIPPQRQNLLVMGKLLQPETRDLREYNLKAGDMVYVTAGVRGQPEATPTPARSAGMEPHRPKPVPVVDHKEVKKALQQRLCKMVVFGEKDGAKMMTALINAHHQQPNGPKSLSITTDNTQLTKENQNDKEKEKEKDKIKEREELKKRDLCKIRADTIIKMADKIEAVIQADPTAKPELGNTTRWPRASETYCVYTRKFKYGSSQASEKTVTGLTSVGLSNPYRNTFYFAVGIGLEILLECASDEARLYDSKGEITAESLSDSWMFGIVYEISQQCFALGLQIRQLIEQMNFLSVELAGVNVPSKYLDPETGRCCVLLGPSNDPTAIRGFNCSIAYQSQWTTQSTLFVSAKLLTFKQCLLIRQDGADARSQLEKMFLADNTYFVSSLPKSEWASFSSSTSCSSTSCVIKTGATANNVENPNVEISTK